MTSNPFESELRSSDLIHRGDDVDIDAQAHHHTLGTGPTQAASGKKVADLELRVADLEARVADLEDRLLAAGIP